MPCEVEMSVITIDDVGGGDKQRLLMFDAARGMAPGASPLVGRLVDVPWEETGTVPLDPDALADAVEYAGATLRRPVLDNFGGPSRRPARTYSKAIVASTVARIRKIQ